MGGQDVSLLELLPLLPRLAPRAGLEVLERLVVALELPLQALLLLPQQLDGVEGRVELPLQGLRGVQDTLEVQLELAPPVAAPASAGHHRASCTGGGGREGEALVELARDAPVEDSEGRGGVLAALLGVREALEDGPVGELERLCRRCDGGACEGGPLGVYRRLSDAAYERGDVEVWFGEELAVGF